MQVSPLRFSTPSRQRAVLRDKHLFLGRPRVSQGAQGGASHETGSAADCVFKRFPSIGDTPVAPRQHD